MLVQKEIEITDNLTRISNPTGSQAACGLKYCQTDGSLSRILIGVQMELKKLEDIFINSFDDGNKKEIDFSINSQPIKKNVFLIIQLI